MFDTTALPAGCLHAATALPSHLRRGHFGVGPLERFFPAVDDLTRPDEDPRTGRGWPILLT